MLDESQYYGGSGSQSQGIGCLEIKKRSQLLILGSIGAATAVSTGRLQYIP